MKAQEALQSIDPLEKLSLNQLNQVEDIVEEDVLAKYRRARLEEMKAQRSRCKFGEIYEITASEYVAEVTEASKADNGKQVVVCLLYEDGIRDSRILREYLKEIAAEHKEIKFCQGVAHKVIPKFKDSAVPTIVIYRGGKCERQIIGTSLFGGPKMTKASVEWVLARKCKIMTTDLLENPLKDDADDANMRGRKGTIFRTTRGGFSDDDEDEEEEQEDDISASLVNTVANDRGFGDSGVDQTVSLIRKLL